MKLPNDTLNDPLACLDRATLDAVQITTKDFRDYVINKLAHVCLRRLKSATIAKDVLSDVGKSEKCKLSVTGPPDKSMISPEEQAGERFASLIASSYIEKLSFDGLELNDRLLGRIKPLLANVHVGKLVVRKCEFTILSPSVFVDALTSFGSIRDRLKIGSEHAQDWKTPSQHITSTHITDAIVLYAAKHRTREVYLPATSSGDPVNVTDESILTFLTAPNRGNEIRRLEITKPRVSPEFFEKLAEAHRSGQITSNVDMKLWAVNVPPPTAESALQFAVTSNDGGITVRFGEELVLMTTKYGSSTIEYKGRNAGPVEDVEVSEDSEQEEEEKRGRGLEEEEEDGQATYTCCVIVKRI